MLLVNKPLVLGRYYKLHVNGKNYPNVNKYISDEYGEVVYNDGLPLSTIHPRIDASCVISGHAVSVDIGNLQSVHAEKLFNDGFIVPKYNESLKRFEIQYRASKNTSEYSVIAHT